MNVHVFLRKYTFAVLVSVLTINVYCQMPADKSKFNLDFEDILNGRPQGWYITEQPGYSVF